MDDILASIRRILNEDDAGGAKPEEGTPAAEPPLPAAALAPPEPNAGGSGGDEDDGVLVLDEAMLVTPPPPEPERLPDPVPIPPPPPPAPDPVMAIPMPMPSVAPEPAVFALPDAGASAGLMAPESTAAAASSVGNLLRTISEERTSQVHRGGPTIEDVVREEMRPLLKVWLDQHLPPLVERLVRQEIERVTGRAVP